MQPRGDKENIYYAVAKVRNGELVGEVDVRPSDAPGLALLLERPIFVAEDILEKAGTVIPEGKTAEVFFGEQWLEREGITLPEGKTIRIRQDKEQARAYIWQSSAIQLWNIVTGKLLTSSPTSPGFMAGSLSWSPDGQDIVYGSLLGGSDSSLVVLDVTTGQRLYTFHPGSGAVSYVNGTWSPDGKYIASLEVRLSETTGETVVLQVWIA